VSAFELDPRLAADSAFVADGPLAQLRLMDDTRFAWLVLVPRVAGAVEWFDLEAADQARLWEETRRAAALLRGEAGCEKLNLGALGNIVRQLHVHVVARRVGDAAWPGPVWGSGAPVRHAPEELAARLARLHEAWAAGA
jgi:diadenosine tetraphosphate (Ap4A) HIT family hydrolase